ncbi:MAG: isoprenyl transferase [Lactobacillus iners]|nr:isoprenyl transferase [Lactobacillus iners]
MKQENKRLDHLAIIMDGNGRWAQERHLPRIIGHRSGMNKVKEIALAANELGVRVLTLYAFSTENWGRPRDEVNYLMKLPINFFDKFMPELQKNNIKVNIMGFNDKLPLATAEIIKKAEQATADNDGMILNFAFNYGSRQEITAAISKIALDIQNKKIEVDSINEQLVSDYLMTAKFGDYADPDLLIRTSGEERLSNFMLWQLAYSEFYFTKTYWPDFTTDEFKKIVEEYQHRDRRFGKI